MKLLGMSANWILIIIVVSFVPAIKIIFSIPTYAIYFDKDNFCKILKFFCYLIIKKTFRKPPNGFTALLPQLKNRELKLWDSNKHVLFVQKVGCTNRVENGRGQAGCCHYLEAQPRDLIENSRSKILGYHSLINCTYPLTTMRCGNPSLAVWSRGKKAATRNVHGQTWLCASRKHVRLTRCSASLQCAAPDWPVVSAFSTQRIPRWIWARVPS